MYITILYPKYLEYIVKFNNIPKHDLPNACPKQIVTFKIRVIWPCHGF